MSWVMYRMQTIQNHNIHVYNRFYFFMNVIPPRSLMQWSMHNNTYGKYIHKLYHHHKKYIYSINKNMKLTIKINFKEKVFASWQ